MGVVGAIEEVGLNAVTGGVGGTALALFRKYWKVGLVALAAIALVAIVAHHFMDYQRARKKRDNLQAWQNVIVLAVKAQSPLAVRKAITASTAADQIRWLGHERATLEQALDAQSAALRIAEQHALAADTGYRQALSQATQRDQARQVTRKSLENPSRTTGVTAEEWSQL